MSRIGKQPVKVPSGVKVNITDSAVKVEGPKGKLSNDLPRGITLKMDNGAVQVVMDKKVPNARALFGLHRTLLQNMVHGVSQGFEKKLEIHGVGYRAQAKGSTLNLSLGFSHPVEYKLPEGIQAKVEANTKVTISGADKMLVGLVAAKVRAFRGPEPYQGKGVRYATEHVRRKQGKAAGAK